MPSEGAAQRLSGLGWAGGERRGRRVGVAVGLGVGVQVGIRVGVGCEEMGLQAASKTRLARNESKNDCRVVNLVMKFGF